ncbi:MAG: DUF1501 domain-containing protein [Gemmataceae bacterium]|nr:DUF1501 domain-containing protein [Gemmataceae bacterium]
MHDGCPGGRQARHTLTRRRLLQVGGLGLLGSLLANPLDASQPQRRARARSVIFLHQYGGPSHPDTFDMKPDAPEQVRGQYRPIRSSAPGIVVCEKLPRTARVMDKVTLVRSVHHGMRNHNSAGYYSLTGFAPPTDDQRLRDSRDLFPAYGSVVDRFAPAARGTPTFVSYPYVIADGSITPGQHASFLGQQHDPFFFTQDPSADDFRLPELSLPDNLTPERLENRREVMNLLDRETRLLEHSARARGLDAHYQRALTMLTSPTFRRAFDLSSEPAAMRERYGRTTYGQGCLLARRLVEAGVRFVTVYFAATIGGQSFVQGGWDTHGFNNNPMYPVLDRYLLPITDHTLPVLLEDLDARGLLDDTVVLWAGEFGRTPRINNIAGRDHWPQCYTVLLAGAGVRRGYVHGASDRFGAYPARDPVRPEDLSATLFHLLGIDPHSEVRDPLNRPLPISTGSVLHGILA